MRTSVILLTPTAGLVVRVLQLIRLLESEHVLVLRVLMSTIPLILTAELVFRVPMSVALLVMTDVLVTATTAIMNFRHQLNSLDTLPTPNFIKEPD